MAGRPDRAATRGHKQQSSRRRAQFVGLGGFLAAIGVPYALWHRAMEIIATDFRLEAEYLLTGWTGYGLIGAGLLFMVPVVVSIGRTPASKLYPRSRKAYAAWGICLYIMGFALASQVAAAANMYSTP